MRSNGFTSEKENMSDENGRNGEREPGEDSEESAVDNPRQLPAIRVVPKIVRQLDRLDSSPGVRAALRLARQLNSLNGSPAIQATQELVQRLDSLNSSPGAQAAQEVARQLNGLSNSPAMQAAQEVARQLASEIERVIVPTPRVLQDLSVSVARTVQPLENRFAAIDEWQSSIEKRMSEIGVPWAMAEHLNVAGVGFARIARLHDLSTGTAPFDPQAVEIFEEELGRAVPIDSEVGSQNRDMAAINAGLNPEVVAFPPPVYPKVLFSAGFEIRIGSMPSVISDGGDSGGVLDSKHKTLLAVIENHLRMMVEKELKALVGDRWYQQRVPGEIWKRWKERKDEDHQERGDSYPIVYYADFTDLAQIICQNRNWNEAFHRYFVLKDDLQVSLRRLNVVRKALAHNRPLFRSDQLFLVSEGYRILTALDYSCLRGGGDER